MSRAADPTEINALVANVLEAAGALRRHGDRQAANVGQTQARWQLLSVVSDEPTTVPAASRRLGVSRQAVQRLADVLRDEGYLRDAPNPAHATSPLFALTPNGRRALTALTNENQPWNRLAAETLHSEDVKTANRVLRALLSLSEP